MVAVFAETLAAKVRTRPELASVVGSGPPNIPFDTWDSRFRTTLAWSRWVVGLRDRDTFGLLVRLALLGTRQRRMPGS